MGGSTLIGEGRNLANSAAYAQNPLIAGAMSNSPTPGFGETFVDQLGGSSAAMKKLGLPLGFAALGGLEPSDLYGEPINMDEAKRKQRYDPNATLNLSGDTGLRLYAAGGGITSYNVGGTVGNPSVGGGLSDLYNRPEGATAQNISADGYGIGRLNNLAGEQSRYQAQTLGYAMGGPVSFADGGDSNKEDALGLPSLSPDMSMDPNAGAGNSAMIQSAMQPTQGMQGNVLMAQGQMPDQSNDSLIAKVTANLKVDPNYQPTNPIEASIVKQLKGTDPMQQGQPSLQGLGSLGPSQPMAPSYNASQSMAPSFNPSVAMSPTYFAGINAPQGYADGGDVVAGERGMNIDQLSSLNLNMVGKPSGNKSGMSQQAAKSSILRGDVGKLPLNPVEAQNQILRLLETQIPGSVSTRAPLDLYRELFPARSKSEPTSYALNLNSGQQEAQYARGGYLDGQGDGMSDSIPATIEGKQPARLADSEFVLPADVVSHIGNGSSKAGAKRLYKMMDKIRMARTGTKKQGKQINPDKYLPA
jgi:hypothetical protein